MAKTTTAPEPTQGNQLAVIERSNYLALQDDSEVREAMIANMGEGEGINERDLTRVPTPAGGGTTWTIPGIAGEETTKEIVGVLVYIQRRGVLWPSEEPTEKRPVLVTHDLINAYQVGDDLGTIEQSVLDRCIKGHDQQGKAIYDWAKLPYNEFGSGKNGSGKRCKESRVLFVLREGDAWPLIVQAQPGSLNNVKQFIVRLSSVPLPHFRAVVGLSLEKTKNAGGQDYSRIVPRLAGKLDKESGAIVQATFTVPLAKMAHTIAFDEPRSDDLDG